VVEVVFQGRGYDAPYAIKSGIESVVSSARDLDAARPPGSEAIIPVGTGDQAKTTAAVTIQLKRTDALDSKPLTDIDDHVRNAYGVIVRIDGVDVIYARLAGASISVGASDVYPWILVTVTLDLAGHWYVAGHELVANGLTIAANGAVVYVNGEGL